MSQSYIRTPYDYDNFAASAKPKVTRGRGRPKKSSTRGGEEPLDESRALSGMENVLPSADRSAIFSQQVDTCSGAEDGKSFLVTVEHKDLNHIYYNATLVNTTTKLTQAKVSTTSSSPILACPGDFEMSVVRFDVNAQNIPIAVTQAIPPTNLDPFSPVPLATTDLFATLTVGGLDYTRNVLIYPQATAMGNGTIFPYGSIFRFQSLLDDINSAFNLAYNDIVSKPSNSSPPQFVWDAKTNLIDLYVDSNYLYGSASIPYTLPYTLPTIQIFVSIALYQYLLGFNNTLNGISRADKKDFRINVFQTNALVQPAPGSRQGLPACVASAPAALYKVEQEAETDQVWNATRSLLLTSNMLPVRTEFVPTLQQLTGDNTSASSSQTIISDFLVPQEENVLKTRNTFQYLPTAEYRMMDLTSTQPIYTIDISMNWSDYRGGVWPLMINPGTSFSVKILFRRKGITD